MGPVAITFFVVLIGVSALIGMFLQKHENER